MASLSANEERFFIQIPDADDGFRLARLEGKEGISALFEFQIEAVCENPNVAIEALIGSSAFITLIDPNNPDLHRYIQGIISQVEIGEPGRSQTTYHFTLVPKIWPLSLHQNSRIFQNASVSQIVDLLLKEAGLTDQDYRFDLALLLDKRDYCVQYRETNLHFIQRLLEDEGVHFYFEHNLDNAVLVMTDSSNTNPQIEVDGAISYYHDRQGEIGEQHIFKFRYIEAAKTTSVTLRDYNFQKPRLDLEEENSTDQGAPSEVFDYPGIFKDAAKGQKYAAIRTQELNTFKQVGKGASDVNMMNAGYAFVLDNHERDNLNIEQLITRVEHKCAQPQVLETGASDEGSSYHNLFTCIPFDTPYRPARTTLRPRVQGTQTATVTGPEGEELYTDEYGRVKVKFHWDRVGGFNEESSCWIRVSQIAASGGFGGFMLPRIGDEVIVDFLEGDPDQPIIIGRVYHGVNHTPYSLPEHKTVSTFKTNSSKDSSGFNEIRFEDKQGQEELFLHAEKNWQQRTKHDRNEWIGHQSHLIVIDDSYSEYHADDHTLTKGHEYRQVQKSQNVSVDKSQHTKVAQGSYLESGTEIQLKAGQKVVIEAGVELLLKGGGSTVQLNPGGVFINGASIGLNSGGGGGGASIKSPKLPMNPTEPPIGTPPISPAQLFTMLKAAPFCEECEACKTQGCAI